MIGTNNTSENEADTSGVEDLPGPKAYPLIGTTYSVDPNNIVQSATKLARKHGRFYRQVIPGTAPFYVVSSFALVDELSDESRFHKLVHPALQVVRNFAGNGLFTAESDDSEWGKAHRILMPAFNPLALRSMYGQMTDIADQLMLKWSRTPSGQSIDVANDFTRLTLDTIALCSFSYRFNSFYTEGFHPFVNAMARGLQHAGRNAHALEIQKKLDILGERRFQVDISTMEDTVDQLISERRQNPSPEGEEDVLDVMMKAEDPVTGEKLSDENLRYQLITFLIAGHETTSGLLSFVVYELIKNPRVLKNAREVTDRVLAGRFPQYEDLKDLGYIDQILREGLRLYPTAPAYAVTPYETTRIGEGGGTAGEPVTVNPGDTLLVLLGHMHRDPAVWSNPEEFRPERFEFENAKNIPHNAWKPFGNGERSCLGRAFAMQEATMVLALLIQHFEFEFADQSYELAMLDGLTSKPKDLLINVSPRRGFPYHGRGGEYGTEAGGLITGEEKIEDLSSVEPNGHKLRLLIGSNAGTSRNHAKKLAAFAHSQGFETELADLDDAVDNLQSGDVVLIATSSYEGLPPDNAKLFYKWLTSGDSPELGGVKYAVIGSGNSEWAETFQRVPSVIDHAMEAAGAHRLIDRGAVDVRGDYLADFAEWETLLWQAISEYFDLEIDNESETDAVQVKYVDEGRADALTTDSEGEFVEGVVQEIVKLSTSADGPINDKFRVDIELPKHVTYSTGDYLEVLPRNPEGSVNRVLNHFSLSSEARIELGGNSTILPVGQVMTVKELLSTYVELSAPISKKHIDILQRQCMCPPEREMLQKLLEPSSFDALLNKRTSLIDLLEQYPSVGLSFDEYLSLLEPLRARRYSISSSSSVSPNRVSLTFSRLESPAWSGRGVFSGVASNYLAAQNQGSKVLVSVVSGNPHFRPDSVDRPMVLVGAGTGIAPLRAFIEERAAAAQQSTSAVEPALLFFGCHGPHSDFLYREELEDWEEKGLVEVRTAFSRHPELNSPQNSVKYVQDKLYENRDEVMDYLSRGARILVCGDAAKVAPAVRSTIRAIVEEYLSLDKDSAVAAVEKMERESFTYVTDAFS